MHLIIQQSGGRSVTSVENELNEIVDALVSHFGSWVGNLKPALSRRRTESNIHWGVLTEEGPRLLTALLLTVPEWQRLSDFVSALNPSRPAESVMREWLIGIRNSNALSMRLKDAQIDMFLILAGGSSRDRVLRFLEDRYGTDDLSIVDGYRAVLRQVEILRPFMELA